MLFRTHQFGKRHPSKNSNNKQKYITDTPSSLGFTVGSTADTTFLFFNQPSTVSIAYVSISYYITVEGTTGNINLNDYTNQSVLGTGNLIYSNLFENLGSLSTTNIVYNAEIVINVPLSTNNSRTVGLSCSANIDNSFVILGITVGYS